MHEKRQHPRFDCDIKTTFYFHEGDPSKIDIQKDKGTKSKGKILDISCGGIFIATNERVAASTPIKLKFKLKKQSIETTGKITRTGLIANNPAETVIRLKKHKIKEELYIAIEFDNKLKQLCEYDI